MGKQKNKRTSSGFVMINENIETLVSFHFHSKYFLFIFSVKKVELIIGGLNWYGINDTKNFSVGHMI